MSGERVKLPVTVREHLGSSESRRLRKQGLVPGVLYGRSDPVAICVPERELRRALTGEGGLHAILDVVVDGGKAHPSILKDYQQDKLRGNVVHVDLQEVRLDQPISATVSVSLVGGDDAPGVREGGVLSQPVREVTVEALPASVPEHIDLDASALESGATVRAADLVLPEGVTLLDDPETVIATVTAPTRVEEPEEMLEGAEEEAAAEAAPSEGEQAEGGSEEPAAPDASGAGGEGTVPG